MKSPLNWFYHWFWDTSRWSLSSYSYAYLVGDDVMISTSFVFVRCIESVTDCCPIGVAMTLQYNIVPVQLYAFYQREYDIGMTNRLLMCPRTSARTKGDGGVMLTVDTKLYTCIGN